MENKNLLIIGNGFDLSLNAHTSYNDFFDYLKCALNSELVFFLAKYKDSKCFAELRDFWKTVYDYKNNYFLKYFINYNESFNTWVSFEEELKRIIMSFDRLLTYLKEDNITSIISENRKFLIYLKIGKDLDLLSVINNNRDNRFFKFQSINDIQPDAKYLFHVKNYERDNLYSVINDINSFCQNFPVELFEELKIFSLIFSKYLKCASYEIDPKKAHPILKFCNNVVSYNYTNYIDNIVEKYDYDEILKINGKIGISVNNNQIVFGIDPSTNIKNHNFDCFLKDIQRSIYNTDIRKIRLIINRQYNNIYIFGHSLSLADKETLKMILTDRAESIISSNKKDYNLSNMNKNGFYANIVVFFKDEQDIASLTMNLKTILGDDVFSLLQSHGMINFVSSKIKLFEFDQGGRFNV